LKDNSIGNILIFPRFIIGTGILMIPFLLLVWAIIYTMTNQNRAIEALAQEALLEKDPIMQLQLLTQEAMILANGKIIFDDAQQRGRFRELSQLIDKSLAESSTLPFGKPDEKEALHDATQEWRKIRALSNQISFENNATNYPETLKKMDDLNKHFYSLNENLHFIHTIANREIEAHKSFTEAIQKKTTLMVVGIFVAAVAIALISGFLLTRSITLSLNKLKNAVKEFASGNLRYRLIAPQGNGFGGLMTAFNNMADVLEENHAVLREEAIRDPLTGLFNLRKFHQVVQEEFERSRRYNHTMSLLLLDLDFFKKINDTYGHRSGDQVLRTVSNVLQQQVRRMDVVCRYGGEEFAVLLPETEHKYSLELANRIRLAIANYNIELNEGETVHITTSIGLSTFPRDAHTPEELVSLADRALYDAKNSGRNTVAWSREADT
jgi:diguanylate cyclase (GGDEF)-like protein